MPTPPPADRARVLAHRILPPGLTGLAGLACAGCCAVPLLIGAGVLGGTGWAAFGSWLPGISVVLAVLAGGAWWWTSRHRRAHATDCAAGACGCSTAETADVVGGRRDTVRA